MNSEPGSRFRNYRSDSGLKSVPRWKEEVKSVGQSGGDARKRSFRGGRKGEREGGLCGGGGVAFAA